MIVLDASALLEVLLQTPVSGAIEARIERAGSGIHAPHLIDVEIAQVIRRLSAAKQIDPVRGEMALTDLADMPLRRYPHTPLLSRIWDLRDNLTAYDAAYVALAEALGIPLLTCDRRLAAASGHGARVELA